MPYTETFFIVNKITIVTKEAKILPPKEIKNVVPNPLNNKALINTLNIPKNTYSLIPKIYRT